MEIQRRKNKYIKITKNKNKKSVMLVFTSGKRKIILSVTACRVYIVVVIDIIISISNSINSSSRGKYSNNT